VAKTKVVVIKKCTGKDDVYQNYFRCPVCKLDYITEGDNFCPKCGCNLLWPEDLNKIEGYEE